MVADLKNGEKVNVKNPDVELIYLNMKPNLNGATEEQKLTLKSLKEKYKVEAAPTIAFVHDGYVQKENKRKHETIKRKNAEIEERNNNIKKKNAETRKANAPNQKKRVQYTNNNRASNANMNDKQWKDLLDEKFPIKPLIDTVTLFKESDDFVHYNWDEIVEQVKGNGSVQNGYTLKNSFNNELNNFLGYIDNKKGLTNEATKILTSPGDQLPASGNSKIINDNVENQGNAVLKKNPIFDQGVPSLNQPGAGGAID